MKRFSIKIYKDLNIWYNHYLSTKFIKERVYYDDFKKWYPLWYHSRRFDKPAIKYRDESCFWWLDDRRHRVGKPAVILYDGHVWYYENGKVVK